MAALADVDVLQNTNLQQHSFDLKAVARRAAQCNFWTNAHHVAWRQSAQSQKFPDVDLRPDLDRRVRCDALRGLQALALEWKKKVISPTVLKKTFSTRLDASPRGMGPKNAW